MHVDGPEPRPEWRHLPAQSRLRGDEGVRIEVLARHDAALNQGAPTYVDPVSGFSVFTADFLAARGYCCESGCRHCPFVD